MITIAAQHILDLAAHMADSPSGDLDWGRRAPSALAYNPATHEIDIINTGRDDHTGDALFRSEDGQAYYGIEDDPDALVVLLDTVGLCDQLDSDCYDEDEKILPKAAKETACWLAGEYAVLLATADAQAATEAMAEATVRRGQSIARLVDAFGGNQSAAGRAIGLDQSTVNKLVQRVRAAG